jgi:RNA polymerase sigma-70 factor (ECF subfamily)
MNELQANLEDQILVMDAQDGDANAMEQLVSRYQKRLWNHAFRLSGDQQGAWDITQQTWLGIIKGLRKLHDPANFKAWAYRIATNKSIDWMRKNKATKHIDIEEIQEPQQQARPSTGIKELLDKLDLRKRMVLSLYYFDQLSVPEISVALKIPRGTVKSRLYKARKELKALWQQQCQ